MKPKVSIIMGIYNCEKTLSRTLESILEQTYHDWELILCDDGSTDGTYSIAEAYAEADHRIRLIENLVNVGLAGTLNRCLEVSRGAFIMRHDGDDVMIAARIEKQLNYMENHQCDVVGAGAYIFDDEDVWGIRQPMEVPLSACMASGGPFIHPTTLFRRACLEAVGGYSDNELTRQRLEDYDLWIKLYEKKFVMRNIQEPLIYFREDKCSYVRKKKSFRIAETRARLQACRRLGLPLHLWFIALKPLLLMLVPATLLRRYHIKMSSPQYPIKAY